MQTVCEYTPVWARDMARALCLVVNEIVLDGGVGSLLSGANFQHHRDDSSDAKTAAAAAAKQEDGHNSIIDDSDGSGGETSIGVERGKRLL